jgi:imidazolonepropionase-like amidohydrolase
MLRTFTAACVAITGLLAPEAWAQDQLAIRGGRIIPIAGPLIDGGVILIRDGKVQAVGKNLSIPADYAVLDAAGKVILPGFIEAHSPRGMDQGNERNNNVPFLSVLDAIDPGQEYFEDCRRNGVTTVGIVPGDDTMIGGQAAVIKTAGTYVEQMIVKRQAGIKLSLRPSANRSRMSHLASLRREFESARDTIQEGTPRPTTAPTKSEAPKAETNGALDPAQPEQQQPETPGGTPEAQQDAAARREAMVRLLKGELPAFIYCDAAMDVPQALKLVREYNLKAILVLGHNCYKAARQVAASKLPVILDPTLVFWESDPRTGEDRKIILPRIYREAGVPVVFQVTGPASSRGFGGATEGPATLGTNYLWYQAATAVKYGTPVAEALEAITQRPAKLLGVDGLCGTIAEGKDADLVILTGDPLKLNTWVHATLVRGKVVYERDKDRKLQHLLQSSKETVTTR